MKKKKVVKKSKVHKVKLNRAKVVRVEADADIHPAVVHTGLGVVEIVPVPRHGTRAWADWWDWLTK